MNELMEIGDIAFPKLGIYLHNVGDGITIFGFRIAFYGIIIALGMMAGVCLATQIAKRTGQNADLYWDFFIYAVIFSVIGARLYYVAFEWDAYKNDLLSIFNLRNGGLAIYGGVIAAFITVYVFSKLKKIKPGLLGDTAVPGLALGQAIGRWGNFFNREVFGRYTDNVLAMRLPIARVRARDITPALAQTIKEGTNYIQVHPTFLYESLWNLALMAFLLFYGKHKKFDGQLCLIYLAGYGLGRAWIEGIRTDQLFISGTTIPVSQVFAIVCVIGSVIADIIIRIRLKKKA